MKTKYKTLPAGYRNLTPTEKIREGDIYTSKQNLTRLTADTTIKQDGWFTCTSGYDNIGKKPNEANDLLKFARPLKPKQSTNEPLGTQSAKTVEGQ